MWWPFVDCIRESESQHGQHSKGSKRNEGCCRGRSECELGPIIIAVFDVRCYNKEIPKTSKDAVLNERQEANLFPIYTRPTPICKQTPPSPFQPPTLP